MSLMRWIECALRMLKTAPTQSIYSVHAVMNERPPNARTPMVVQVGPAKSAGVALIERLARGPASGLFGRARPPLEPTVHL